MSCLLEGRSVAIRVGEQPTGDGFSEWEIVVQVRHPAADYDAVLTIRCCSETPPDIEDILLHYQKWPEDFTFLDFLPNLKKQPRRPSRG